MKFFCNIELQKMPSHEQVEQFFIDFAREMREQGHFIMDDYKHDWVGLLTKDEIRNLESEDQNISDDSELDN